MKSAGFKKVAETYGKLRNWSTPARPGRNWNDATSLVITGKAGGPDHGRLGQGRVHRRRPDAGKEYGCTVGLGRGGYVMGGDVFVFPKIEDPAAAEGAGGARQGDARARRRRSRST